MTAEVELRVRLRAVLDRKVRVRSDRDMPFDPTWARKTSVSTHSP